MSVRIEEHIWKREELYTESEVEVDARIIEWDKEFYPESSIFLRSFDQIFVQKWFIETDFGEYPCMIEEYNLCLSESFAVDQNLAGNTFWQVFPFHEFEEFFSL